MIRPSSAAHRPSCASASAPASVPAAPQAPVQGTGGMRSPSPPPSSIDTRPVSPSYSPWGSDSSSSLPSSPLRPGSADTTTDSFTSSNTSGSPAASIQLPLPLPLPRYSPTSSSTSPPPHTHHSPPARPPQPLSDPRDSAALLWTSLIHASCRFPPPPQHSSSLPPPPPPLGLLSTLRRGIEGTRDAASDGAPIHPPALALILASVGVLAKCRVGTCAAVGVWADVLGAILDLVLVRTVWVGAGARHDGARFDKVAEACGSAVAQVLVALLDASHASLIASELDSFFDRVTSHLTTHSAYPSLFPTLSVTLSHAHAHGVRIPRGLVRAILASLPHAATHDASFALFSFCLSLAIHPTARVDYGHVHGDDPEPTVEVVAVTSLLHPYTSRISAWDIVRSQLIAQLLTTLEPDSEASPADPFPLATMRFGALDRVILHLCACPKSASPQSVAQLEALEFLLLVLTHASPALHKDAITRGQAELQACLIAAVTQAKAVSEVAVGLKCLSHAVRLVHGGELARVLVDVVIRTRRRWGHDLRYAQAVLEAMHVVPRGFVGSDAIPILDFLSSLRSADLRSRFTTWLTSHALPHLPPHHFDPSLAPLLHFITATYIPSLSPTDQVHAYHACAGSHLQQHVFPPDHDVHAYVGRVSAAGVQQQVAVIDSPPRAVAGSGGGGSSGSVVVHGGVQPPVDHLHALDMPESLDELVEMTRRRRDRSRVLDGLGGRGGGDAEEAWMNRLGIRWVPLVQPELSVESVHVVAEPISPPDWALLALSAHSNLMRVAADLVSPGGGNGNSNGNGGSGSASIGTSFGSPSPFSVNGGGRNSPSPPPPDGGGPRRMPMPSDALDGLMVASMSDAELYDAIPVRD